MKDRHQRSGDLEINQDPGFQRRSWIAERIVWSVMATILLLALAGLFGRGTFSHVTTGRQGEFWAEYERFVRFQASSELRVHVRASKDRLIKVSFDRSYSSNILVEQIVPPPETSESAEDGVTYVFRAARADEAAIVTFYFKPLAIGPMTGRLAFPGFGDLSIRQFAYP